jgi:hypothetical protein
MITLSLIPLPLNGIAFCPTIIDYSTGMIILSDWLHYM